MVSATETFGLKLALALAALYLLVQLPLLTTVPGVMIDEPWYADVAHNAAQGNGFVNSTNGAGGGDKMFLFTGISSLLYRTFGTTLWTARFVSVLAGLAGLLGLLAILRRFAVGRMTVILVSLCFIFSNVYYVIFRSVRPEGLTAALGIWALYFALVMVDSRLWKPSLLAGLFSGLAFLSHPNGALYVAIFGMTSLVLAIRHRSAAPVLGFAAGGIPAAAALVIFAYVQWGLDPFAFFGKMLYRTNVGKGGGETGGLLATVQRFFVRYSLGLKRLPIVLFEFAALVGILAAGRGKSRLVATWGAVFFAVAVVFLNPFATRHFGEVLFFVFVALAPVLDGGVAWLARHQRWQRALVGVTSLYLLYNVAGDGYLWYRQAGHTAYADVAEWIDEQVPDDAVVLSLYQFYFPLSSNTLYSGYTRFEYFEAYDDLDGLIASGDLDYIVISDFMAHDAQTTSGRRISPLGQNRQLTIYQTIRNAAVAGGTKVGALETTGYGLVEVFKMRPIEEEE